MASLIKSITKKVLKKHPIKTNQGINYLIGLLKEMNPVFWATDEIFGINYAVRREEEFRDFLYYDLKKLFKTWSKNNQGQDNISCEKLFLLPKVFSFVNIAGQSVLMISTPSYNKQQMKTIEDNYSTHLVTAGLSPTWNQMVSRYVQFNRPETIYKSFGTNRMMEIAKNTKFENKFSEFKDLLKHNSFIDLKSLKKKYRLKNHEDYISLYTQAVINGIEGFENTLPKKLDTNKLGSLQFLASQLEEVVESVSSIEEFTSYILRIHEEYKLLLIDNPYQSADYQSILANAFPYKSNQQAFGYATGGMASLNQCLHIIRNPEGKVAQPILERLTSKHSKMFLESNPREFLKKYSLRSSLNILIANDNNNYYENELLIHSKYDHIIKLKGTDNFNFENMKKCKYDVVVLAIDPICSSKGLFYTSVEIPLLLEKLDKNNMLADNATLICDVTTSTLNHIKLHQIIKFIDDKKLSINVMAYASAAKTISLGLDNLQSAIIMLIAANNSTNAKNLIEQTKLSIEPHIQTPDFQYLNHLLKHCHKICDDYSLQISNNARYLLNVLEEKNLLYDSDKTQNHLFAAAVDKSVIYYPYIDLIYDNKSNRVQFYNYLSKQLNAEKISIASRNSFGFPMLTASPICENVVMKADDFRLHAGGKFRISPGLLTQAQLETFAEVLAHAMITINKLESENSYSSCFRRIIKN